jgi:predicted amidohydrolase
MYSMTPCRIALANVSFPATPAASVELAELAIAEAGTSRAEVICFPECFVPGYRLPGKNVPPPDAEFLEQ